MTDVSRDPTEPAPSGLLDLAPPPQQPAGGRASAGGTPNLGGIRVVPDAEATARLRIMLPAQAPTPSTALRPQAAWEDTHTEDVPSVEAFARVAASPASPSTLPAQLAAMTTATMVIPLPPSLRPGSGLLTTTLPPDQAAQANAARIGEAFRDTIEEIFGVDLDTVDPAEVGLPPLEQRTAAPAGGAGSTVTVPRAVFEPGYASEQYRGPGYRGEDYQGEGYAAEDYGAGYQGEDYGTGYPGAAHVESGSGYAGGRAGQGFPPVPALPRSVPAEVFGGAYGVPTQHPPLPAPADPFGQNPRGLADPNRHALALRYLGGIFHDSSGESSYLDPEELDQGWIPSAFGAVPPDAPTEQLARVPAAVPPSGRPVGTAVPATAAADDTALLPPVREQPAPSAPSTPRAVPVPSAVPTASPAPTPRAVPAPSAVPVPPAAEPGRGRSGSRGAHVPQRGHRSKPARAVQSPRHGVTVPVEQDDAEHDGSGGREGRGRTLTVLALCAAALALLYGIALLAAGGVLGGTVPSGVSVDGVSLAGLSQDAARDTLRRQLGPVATRPIELLVGQTPVALDPAKAGLSLDVSATVAAAQAERTNPFTVIPALFGVGHQVDPVITVDQTRLTNALDQLAAVYDTQLVEGKITFTDAKPVVTAPRVGRGFDVAAAVSAVGSGYLRTSAPIVLPVNALTPLATPEALQAALQNLARPAVSGPITLVTGGVSSVLTPTEIGAALTVEPDQNGAMVPAFDGAMLRADLDPAALATEQPGVDAAFIVVGGEPRLVPEKDGAGYSEQALANAVGGALTKTGAGRTVTVPRGPLPPAFTTADAQALGVQSVLGAATLSVPDAPDRADDTRRAASLVTGSVVQPGAVWSFDKTVGAPTSANGFAEPSGDGRDGVDVSGGDDLVATAVFDAAFRAGMGDTLHHPNAAYTGRYPVGLDAAVVYPGTDLQWTNSGGHPVYVYASYANGSLTVDLLGQPSYDAVDVNVSKQQNAVAPSGGPLSGCPAQPAADGFQVDVTRVLMRQGAQVGTEQFHVTYVPFVGTSCDSGSTHSGTSGSGSTSDTPSTGSSTGAPSGGSTGSGGSAGGGGSGGTGSSPPSSPSQPTPAPTNTGVLGGLLH